MDALSMGGYSLNDLVNLVGKPTLMIPKNSIRFIVFECKCYRVVSTG